MQQTMDYTIFKKLEGNQPIVQAHVQRLVEAIQKKNLLSIRPIIVNKNMQVVDGQHRLEAAKILCFPIYYIEAEKLNIQDVAVLNTNQRNWKMETFLYVYSDHIKNENYIKLKQWIESFDLSLNQGIAFFIEEGNLVQFRNSFKSGEFVFNEKAAEFADPYSSLIKKIESSAKYSRKEWKCQGFIRSFLQFYSNEEIDKTRFWDQVDKYGFILSPKRSKQEYLEMLYELYNYRKHIRVEM